MSRYCIYTYRIYLENNGQWKNEKMRLEKISGWWLNHPSEIYELVSWDDDIPKIWKVIKFIYLGKLKYVTNLN